ncbi:MAG: hypothetical protein OSA97_12890 [Nevskia sp.]|nr:hypothetical protein [Nevskia sp.]
MTDDEYVQTQGLRCPYCREHDVEGVGGVEIDAGYATQEVRCNKLRARLDRPLPLDGLRPGRRLIASGFHRVITFTRSLTWQTPTPTRPGC